MSKAGDLVVAIPSGWEVVTFDPGIFPSATIVLLGTCYDPILSKQNTSEDLAEALVSRTCFTQLQVLVYCYVVFKGSSHKTTNE